MKGVVVNYKRSGHRTSGNQLIIQAEGVKDRDAAAKLVGKTVTWNTGKRALSGVVASAHGKQGAVRVRFETGMPGQCAGQEVTFK